MSTPFPEPAPPSSRSRRRTVAALVLVALAIAGAGAWYYTSRPESPPAGDAAPAKDGKARAGRGGRGGGDPNRVQPVSAAAAHRADVNIVQTALGTVTALRTVTVKPRVDGMLQSVAFTEGQLVKQGEVLAQLDPVPFQTAARTER